MSLRHSSKSFSSAPRLAFNFAITVSCDIVSASFIQSKTVVKQKPWGSESPKAEPRTLNPTAFLLLLESERQLQSHCFVSRQIVKLVIQKVVTRRGVGKVQS